MSEVKRSEIERKLLLINELLCDNTFFKLGCTYCNIYYSPYTLYTILSIQLLNNINNVFITNIKPIKSLAVKF